MNKIILHRLNKVVSSLLLVIFTAGNVCPQAAMAQSGFSLPIAGSKILPSKAFQTPLLRAVLIDPAKPFDFDFLVDDANAKFQPGQDKAEYEKLIRYFLAALTVPEKDLWVNLSPTEKNRIVPQSLGETELGRDMLAQDYLLKQLAASMVGEISNGENNGLQTDFLSRIWIVPQSAKVYEHNGGAFVTQAHLRVMFKENRVETQNLASLHAQDLTNTRRGASPLAPDRDITVNGRTQWSVPTDEIKQTILPAIEREINEGAQFAPIRQIYNSLILAAWYKTKLKNSLLNQIYANENKIAGIDLVEKNTKEKIYQQYLDALKKGVTNYVKEEYDPATQEIISKKYFTGGEEMFRVFASLEVSTTLGEVFAPQGNLKKLNVSLQPAPNRSVAVRKTEPEGVMKAFGRNMLMKNFKVDENNSDEQRFENTQETAIVSLFLSNRLYSRNHQATKYLQGLLDDIVRDVKATIYIIDDDTVEAFATPSGQIFVSRGAILEFCTSKEATYALLMHELTHIEKKHGKQKTEKGNDSFSRFALTRFFEFEADIASMRELDNRGINSAGAMELTDNMVNYFKKEKQKRDAQKQGNVAHHIEIPPVWKEILKELYDMDMEHGSPTQRGMNLRDMTRFVDFKHLKNERNLIDWDNLEIKNKGETAQDLTLKKDLTTEEFLSTLAFLHEHNRPYKKFIQTFIKQRNLNLDKKMTALVLQIFESFILSNTNPENLKDTKVFEADLVLDLLRSNVFEKLGIPFSSGQLKGIYHAMLINLNKSVDENNENQIFAKIREFKEECNKYFRTRYVFFRKFEKELNTVTIYEYLKTFEVNPSAKIDIVKIKIDGIESDVLQFNVNPLANRNLERFKNFLNAVDLGLFGIDFLMGDLMNHIGRKSSSKDVYYRGGKLDFKLDSKYYAMRGAFDFYVGEAMKYILGRDFLRAYSPLEKIAYFYKAFLILPVSPAAAKFYSTPEKMALNEALAGLSYKFYKDFTDDLEKIYSNSAQLKVYNLDTYDFEIKKDILSALEEISSAYFSELRSKKKDKIENLIIGSEALGGEYANLPILERPQFVPERHYNYLVKALELGIWRSRDRSKKKFLAFADKLINLFAFEDPIGFFKDYLELVKATADAHDLTGIEQPFNFEVADLKYMPRTQEYLKIAFLGLMGNKKNTKRFQAKAVGGLDNVFTGKEILREARKFITRFPMAYRNIDRIKYEEKWKEISMKVNSYLSNSANYPNTSTDFEEILSLALLTQDSLSSTTIVITSLKEMVKRSKDFNEAFGYIKKYAYLPPVIIFEALDTLLLEHAKRTSHMEELFEWAQERTKNLLKEGYGLGKFEFLQGTLRFLKAEDRKEFIKAALTTGESDEQLKKLMSKAWWHVFMDNRFRANNMAEMLQLAFAGEKTRNTDKLQMAAFEASSLPEIAGFNDVYFNDVYSTMFRLDSVTIYLLLRALCLEGDKSVLRSKEAKESLVDHVINNYVKVSQSPSTQKVISYFKSIIAEELDPEDVFYFLGPSLTAMALQKPKKEFNTNEIVDDLVKKFFEDPPSPLKIDYAEFFADPSKFPQTLALVKMRIESYVTGIMPKLKYVDQKLTAQRAAKVPFVTFESQALDEIADLVPERKTFSQQVTPMELSVEVSKQMGSLAVRLLQLAGMFFDLSNEDRETISSVYDAVKGQNKLQMYDTFKRASEKNPKFRVIFENIAEIGNMLGGGSIVTVNSITDKDQKKWAAGVNNPNVAFRVGELKRFADKIIDGFIKREPENQNYRILKDLLGVAHRWINKEIDDPDYVAKNLIFTAQNDYRSSDPKAFKSLDGTTHPIEIPTVLDTGEKGIRWETEIHGRTLNKWLDEYQKAKKENNKVKIDELKPFVQGAVANIVQNYVHQLDARLAHSDVHPGQYIVDEENKALATLDRKNLLEFTPEEGKKWLTFLKQVIKDWDSKEDANTNLVQALKDFLESSKTPSDEKLENAKTVALEKIKGKSVEEIVQTILWTLSQSNIQIPDEGIVLLKNFVAINRMSKLADFSNILDALMYDPLDPDKVVSAGEVLKTVQRLAPNMSKDLITPEVIAQLAGKKIAAIWKNSTLIAAVKSKTSGWLEQLKNIRKKPISKQTREKVELWFRKIESSKRFSVSQKAAEFGVSVDELKEMVGYGLTYVDGTHDDAVKTNGGESSRSIAIEDFKREAGHAQDVGGVDLTNILSELDIEGASPDLQLTDEERKKLDVPGFVPVIKSITPVLNLPAMLGVSSFHSEPELAHSS